MYRLFLLNIQLKLFFFLNVAATPPKSFFFCDCLTLDLSALRALQEENADLHQNLLQTVVCIESLEAELQRTRDELSHVKEKYKRLGVFKCDCCHVCTFPFQSNPGLYITAVIDWLDCGKSWILNRAPPFVPVLFCGCPVVVHPAWQADTLWSTAHQAHTKHSSVQNNNCSWMLSFHWASTGCQLPQTQYMC